MRGKRFLKWKEANTTIEAAVIVPMIITLLVIGIYLFFYRYNCVCLTRAAYCSALRASQKEYATAKEQKEEAEEAVKKLLNKNLLAANSYEKKISVKNNQITVSLQFKQKIPFSNLVKVFTKTETLSYAVTKKARQSNPYQFIRLCNK